MSGPGRPRGRTAAGDATRERLFAVAIRLFGERGFAGTTLRAIAKEAGVSPGLVYKHFRSKEAIVLALYGELSVAFSETTLPEGSWTDRSSAGLRASLDTLAPHRDVLAGVLPALLTDREAGLLSAHAAESRALVRGVFLRAVADAQRPPSEPEVLGRLVYLLQLGVLLWWLLDRSPDQRATDGLLTLLDRFGPALGPILWVPGVMASLRTLDALATDALYEVGDP